MKIYRKFIVEAGLVQGKRKQAKQPKILVKRGPGNVMNRIVNSPQSPTPTPQQPTSSVSPPQKPKGTPLSQRVSSALSSKPVRYGTRALNVVGTLASGVSEYQRRRAEGESDAEAKRNAAIVTGLETAGGYGGASLAGGLTSASGPGAVVAGVGGYAAGSSAAGSIARSLLPTPKERKERINQPVVRARQQLAKTKTPGTVAGSGVVGAGGQSIVSRTPKGATFISTGTGKQRRTAQLPSQMLLPSGRVGDLAFKNNKPTYLARPSLEQQRQDPVSRFQRWANPAFRQAERDVEARQRRQAAASTRQYYGQLGITPQKQQQLNPAAKPVKPKTAFSGKLK